MQWRHVGWIFLLVTSFATSTLAVDPSHQKKKADPLELVPLVPKKPKKKSPTWPNSRQLENSKQRPGVHIGKAKPWYKKWWVWTIAGALVAGGVTTTAVLLTRGGGTPKPPAIPGIDQEVTPFGD